MAQKPLSLRAYAQHRKLLGLPGGSLQSVQRAIEAERISFMLVGGQKRIPDPDAADREWAANTDHSRAPGSVKDQADWFEDEGDDGVEPSLRDASAREKHWKALTAELNYRRQAGELVEAAAAEERWLALIATAQTKLLAIGSRMKQRLPHLTISDIATIDDLVRESLEELADGR
jgi:hypothetical protein